MTTERDSEQFKQPAGKSQEGKPPTDQAQQKQNESGQASEDRQPTGQSEQGQSGGSSQPPAGSTPGSDTMTEQKSDIASENTDTTGEDKSAGFVGQQSEDSGDYLRKEETGESEKSSEETKNFGTNGE